MRSKAAFSKGTRKANPRRPGRKPGPGRFANRPEPEPRPQDAVEDIDVPLAAGEQLCPGCGVPLDITREQATVEDTPPQPVRVIRRFTVEVGRCPRCGRSLRGRHPELGPRQSGANAHQVGTNVKAQALALHYHSGLPLRKVPQVIAQGTGIRLTQGRPHPTGLLAQRGRFPADRPLRGTPGACGHQPGGEHRRHRLAHPCHAGLPDGILHDGHRVFPDTLPAPAPGGPRGKLQILFDCLAMED